MDNRKQHITEAFLTLGAEKPLAAISFSELAEQAKLSEKDLKEEFPKYQAIIDAIVTELFYGVIDGFNAETEDSVKESLFDIMMELFEALQEKRAFFLSLETYLLSRPQVICARKSDLHRIFLQTLGSVGIGNKGLLGHLRGKALQAGFWATYRVWRRDESDDLAATMAELDRILSRLEMLENRRKDMPFPFGGHKNAR